MAALFTTAVFRSTFCLLLPAQHRTDTGPHIAISRDLDSLLPTIIKMWFPLLRAWVSAVPGTSLILALKGLKELYKQEVPQWKNQQ